MLYWLCCRQYYTYISDPECKRVGTQCWVYGAIMATEALICFKNGKELFGHTQAMNIILWLLLIFLLSCLCVYGCVLWHKYFQVSVCAVCSCFTYFVWVKFYLKLTVFVWNFTWVLDLKCFIDLKESSTSALSQTQVNNRILLSTVFVPCRLY